MFEAGLREYNNYDRIRARVHESKENA